MQAMPKKKHRFLLRRAPSLLGAGILLLLAAALLVLSKEVGDGVREGLSICTNVVIPSLFPFMILSSFLALSPLSELISRPLSPITRRLFHLPPELGATVLMSFVGGYPVGAKTIASLVREKKLSQETAARMLCFSVNAGPSFLIGTVGVALLGSPRLGWILLFAQSVSAFLIGGIVSRRAKISRGETGGVGLPFSAAFVEAVSGAASGMFGLCAFITAFSGILALLRSSGVLSGIVCLLAKIAPSSLADPNLFEALLGGLLEVTSGCVAAAGLKGDLPFVVISLLISFSGVSVIFQVASCLRGSGVRLSPFVLSRFAHAFLTSAIAYPLYLKWGREVMTALGTAARLSLEVSPTSVLRALCILAMCAILLLTASTAPLQAKK